MGKDHSHHHHSKNKSLRVLSLAILLTFSFAVIEALSGWWSGSLTLLSDAGHMTSDAFALLIAMFAVWLATKPPSMTHSYGLGRAEVVAAWFSSLLLLGIAVLVIVEAFVRFHEPSHVKSLPVILVGLIGLMINLLIAWVLSRGERTLNVRAAMLHVLGDILGSLAAVISGAVIYATHWVLIDPILSVFIGVLIIIASLRLLRESFIVLMEGVPQHININSVKATLNSVMGVKDVHDLHVWTLSSGITVLSAHIDIHEIGSWQNILSKLSELLKEQHNIDHITLQPEPEVFDCQPCDPS